MSDLNWISGQPLSPGTEVLCKLRYRHNGVICRVEAIDSDKLELSFVRGWDTVSVGQAAVFYNTMPGPNGLTELLGGGIILS